MINADWSYDAYWQKTKLYVVRAHEYMHDTGLFSFWYFLALEHLGRATLAKIHPVLLADPQEGDNILHALGYVAKKPKSVTASTVFKRCQRIIEKFTLDDEKKCELMMARRNEELHSGSLAFENFKTSQWLADYYKISNILLEHQNKTLDDLFGQSQAIIARKMLVTSEKKLINLVKQAIADAVKRFANYSDEEKKERIAKISTRMFSLPNLHLGNRKLMKCFVCGSNALLTGEIVRINKPRFVDDEFIQDQIILPTHYQCFVCELKLDTYNALLIASDGSNGNLPDDKELCEQFLVPVPYDDEYYNEEPDYGND